MDLEETAPLRGAGPEPALEGAARPPRRRTSRLALAAMFLGVLIAVGVLVGFEVRMPYTTIAPGEALSLPPLVTVTGAKSYPEPRGDIRLLFVREANHVNFWQYVRARLDSDIDLVKDTAVNPGNLSQTQLRDQGLQQMADAKAAATAVALRAAGYKVGVTTGVVVSDFDPRFPAIKVLHFGDTILAADGRPVTVSKDLSAAVAKHKAGETVTLDVLRAGKRITVRCPIATNQGRKVIGVLAAPRLKFPFPVKVDTTNIGGPSAGLAMTLAIYDDLTPGDLTGGHRVAVTGTIDAAGNVGEIGGIQQKAISARAAHVSLFLVPQCSPDDPAAALAACKADLTRTAQRAGSKIKVVPVSSFAQALDVLRENGGAVPSSSSSTTSTTIAA
ncbi:MAG TPA: PDZ domain-containing protein [Acidimicrobiia bacterium]|jgi:PDZ domain-containing protein|nr:PDZ domain-containing protein [Acidimicrobiia bacterium]